MNGKLLQETVYGIADSAAIDRAQGIIRNVALLRPESRNRRRYSRKAMVEYAAKLKANPRGYIDHAQVDAAGNRIPPSLLDLMVEWRNIRFDEQANKVFADAHLIGTAEENNRILERASKAPHLFGVSIVAAGDGHKDKNGFLEVTSIDVAYSADLVSEPAATQNLYESYEPKNEENMKKLLKELLEEYPEQFKEHRDSVIAEVASPERTAIAIRERDEWANKVKLLETENAGLKAQIEKDKRGIEIRAKLVEAKLEVEKHFPLVESMDDAKIGEYIKLFSESKIPAPDKKDALPKTKSDGGEFKPLSELYK